MASKLPTVAIIGRANAGKSSLFNRFVKSKQAIVAREAGTTRDNVLGKVTHSNDATGETHQFWLVDTAGLKDPNDEFEASIQDQITEAADVADLADRHVDELSGGQRQRAWLAMALAQDTPLLLLDEPTTYLDLAHQIEVLSFTRRLRDAGRTVVVVLHDLTLAAAVADRVVVLDQGQVVAHAPPMDALEPDVLRSVFGLDGHWIEGPNGPLLAARRAQ